jgi:hypothetical protein
MSLAGGTSIASPPLWSHDDPIERVVCLVLCSLLRSLRYLLVSVRVLKVDDDDVEYKKK